MQYIPINFLFLLCTSTLFGQSIQPSLLSTSANYYRNSDDISLHSSLGEMATEALFSGNLHLSQGFLQAYFDLVPTADLSEPAIKVIVGPNPCHSTFSISKDVDSPLMAQLHSLQGQLLQQHKLSAQQTRIDVSNLAAGPYFLVVLQDGKQVFETTKIIKL